MTFIPKLNEMNKDLQEWHKFKALVSKQSINYRELEIYIDGIPKIIVLKQCKNIEETKIQKENYPPLILQDKKNRFQPERSEGIFSCMKTLSMHSIMTEKQIQLECSGKHWKWNRSRAKQIQYLYESCKRLRKNHGNDYSNHQFYLAGTTHSIRQNLGKVQTNEIFKPQGVIIAPNYVLQNEIHRILKHYQLFGQNKKSEKLRFQIGRLDKEKHEYGDISVAMPRSFLTRYHRGNLKLDNCQFVVDDIFLQETEVLAEIFKIIFIFQQWSNPRKKVDVLGIKPSKKNRLILLLFCQGSEEGEEGSDRR